MISTKYNWDVKFNHQHDDEIVTLAKNLNLTPLLVEILIGRGYKNVDDIRNFLEPSLTSLHDPFLINDMQKAVDRIQTAIGNEEQITVYGDYDADGLTSTSILYETLMELGANVNYYIPNRFKDGYGPNVNVFEEFINQGTSLIITVDNGVAGNEAIALANSMNCDVIISDHHELPSELPDAYAIVHAKVNDCEYPFKSLSGAGIAFKLSQALIDEIPQDKLDLAIIGTIADLVPLIGENRALVQFGLNAIKYTMRPGLLSLIKKSGVKLESLNEQDIGFAIGPRLNALGRMGDANVGVELLTTIDENRAKQLADDTDKNNIKRKELVDYIAKEAEKIANSEENQNKKALILAGKDWQTGVLGIVASKIVSKFNKPTIILGIDSKTNVAKGSGRSVDGFDLFKGLDGSRDLMEAFGGHEMAVGLTIKADKINELSSSLEERANQQNFELSNKPNLPIAISISSDEINMQLYQDIQKLSPFGNNNEYPKLEIIPSEISKVSVMGKTNEHLKIELKSKNDSIAAVAFGKGNEANEINNVIDNLKIAGHLNLNEWKGKKNIQIMIDDLATEGMLITDKRTKNLSESMFKKDGTYIFFHDKLADKLSGYIGSNSDVKIADDINELKENVFIVDCPDTIDDLKLLMSKVEKQNLIFYLYKKTYCIESGMPSRQDYAKLFKFIETQNNIDISNKLKEISNHLKIDGNLLIFMIQVFLELGFITVKHGIMNGVKNPAKKSIETSASYQLRIKQLEVEKMLLKTDKTTLVHTINDFMA
ncbi:single-stranded-DNA-specific exonuclease RecJ [Lactobacillus sp. S2-2]|uniref:single-stranded-DNA-specific exonuclease RecJ n=1 Tax=Lactobacillus sp. S2-2 TaxID=2692917 RepID=UPI001F007B8D|nr:single-stranded-DNA-specific exonuclease RecJ [Lactobacillus sp. S2-2]